MNPSFPKLRKAEDSHSSRVQDNVDSVLKPLANALNSTPIMGAAAPAWIQPSLLNGFANFGTPYATAGFHVDCLGYVHCKGYLQNAAGAGPSTAIMKFPPGARPAQTQSFAVEGAAGAAQFVFVDSQGYAYNANNMAAGDVISFAFSFLGEQ